MRAEELESRVAVNPIAGSWRSDQMYERASPPLSGRSTPSPRPSLQSRDYVHKYHTLNSSVRLHLFDNCALNYLCCAST
jgi:hypothetical protein